MSAPPYAWCLQLDPVQPEFLSAGTFNLLVAADRVNLMLISRYIFFVFLPFPFSSPYNSFYTSLIQQMITFFLSLLPCISPDLLHLLIFAISRTFFLSLPPPPAPSCPTTNLHITKWDMEHLQSILRIYLILFMANAFMILICWFLSRTYYAQPKQPPRLRCVLTATTWSGTCTPWRWCLVTPRLCSFRQQLKIRLLESLKVRKFHC